MCWLGVPRTGLKTTTLGGRYGNAFSVTGCLKHELKNDNALDIGRWKPMTKGTCGTRHPLFFVFRGHLFLKCEYDVNVLGSVPIRVSTF